MKRSILFILIMLFVGNSFGMKRTKKYHNLLKEIKLEIAFEDHSIESKFIEAVEDINIFMHFNKKLRDEDFLVYLDDASWKFIKIVNDTFYSFNRLRKTFGNHKGRDILVSHIDRFIDVAYKNNLCLEFFSDLIGVPPRHENELIKEAILRYLTNDWNFPIEMRLTRLY